MAGALEEEGVMEQRKRKRMMSNRESARRSRQKKQKHLDELTEQVARLKKENTQIAAALCLTTQHCLAVESENSVLRTQAAELGSRLQALNEILSCCCCCDITSSSSEEMMMMTTTPWSFVSQQQQQPIMDVYQYC